MVLEQWMVGSEAADVFKYFDRVMLQDSTSLRLPDYLASMFKGSVSKGKEKAIAKLNLVMDVLSGKFLQMQRMSFNKTEQAISGNILDVARESLRYHPSNDFSHFPTSPINSCTLSTII